MGPRPTSITVMAILGIVYAALTLFGTPCSWLFVNIRFGPPNPAMDAMMSDPVYLICLYGAGGLSMLLAFLLLAGSIGSLKLKPAARSMMLIWSILTVVINIVGTLLTFIFVLPPLLHHPGMEVPAIGGFVGGCFGLAFGAALPVCILMFYNRKIAKDAFQGIFPAPPTNFPVQFPQQS